MKGAIRNSLLLSIVVALSACAAAPPREQKVVDVSTGTLTPEYSSINARVLTEAASVDHTFVASLDPGKEPLTRLQSTYTQSFGDDADQLRVGDSVSSVGMWGTAVRYGGMQFGTRSAARDDVIDSSQLATSGVAVLPTVADALFASAGDPGTSLAQQNLSVDRSIRGGGPGAWSLTAEDAQGRSASIDAPMIASTRLVERGCGDFSVGLGKVRQDYALISNEYGPMFANTTVKCAAPLGFTVEGHGEYLADEVAAVGVGLARQVGPLGTASMAFAQSHAGIGSGWLARFGFEHRNPLFDLALRSRIQSREFREVGTTMLADPVMQRDLASVGLNVTEGSNLSFAYAAQTTWARQRTNLLAVKQSVAVGRGSLSVSAGHSLEDNFGTSLFISYRRPFGLSRPARSSIDELDLDLLDSQLVQ
jgi:outer membrane usher protein FimD/PapC